MFLNLLSTGHEHRNKKCLVQQRLALQRAQLKKLVFETCRTTWTHHLQQHLQIVQLDVCTRHKQTCNLERRIICLKDLRTQTAPGKIKTNNMRRQQNWTDADRQSGVQDDNERDDASDDSQIPQPVRISREFWGPRGTGRRSYCQRLFIVVFEDGTQESLVAEDLLDGCAEPFEENVFYANVLKDWRQEHAKAVRPVVAPR